MKKEVIKVPGRPDSRVLSAAVRVGDMIWTSVQNGRHPDTREMAPDFPTQARYALENLKRTIEAAGGSLQSVVKVTIYFKNIVDREAFNQIYFEYFETELPARASFGNIDLGGEALVEVEAIAVVES